MEWWKTEEGAEFVEAIRQMREAQRTYFKSKSTNALDWAKRLERQVDKSLDKITHDQKQTLFPE